MVLGLACFDSIVSGVVAKVGGSRLREERRPGRDDAIFPGRIRDSGEPKTRIASLEDPLAKTVVVCLREGLCT